VRFGLQVASCVPGLIWERRDRRYSVFANRLPGDRTYGRNLRWSIRDRARRRRALVSDSDLGRIEVKVEADPESQMDRSPGTARAPSTRCSSRCKGDSRGA